MIDKSESIFHRISKTPDPDRLDGRLAELRARVREISPEQLAFATGSRYRSEAKGDMATRNTPFSSQDSSCTGTFCLHLWGEPVDLSFPELLARFSPSGSPLPALLQALLLFYFSESAKQPPSDRPDFQAGWISFADLPNGRFYNQAFQGYTGDELVKAFGNDLTAFQQAARLASGKPVEIGNAAAFAFQALPRLALAIAYWPGDEDFLPSCQILFEAAAGTYLTTDGCALLGSGLARRLLQLKR
jgi:hypothetical protein